MDRGDHVYLKTNPNVRGRVTALHDAAFGESVDVEWADGRSSRISIRELSGGAHENPRSKARKASTMTRRITARPRSRRSNPWPARYRTQGAKYDRCLAAVGPGYNPFAVCGAALKKTMGKRAFSKMLSAKRRMAKSNPSEYAPLNAEELVLYAMNDGALYRSTRQPLEMRMLEAYAHGRYSAEAAQRGWKSFASEAARKYYREFHSGDFSAAAINTAAKDMRLIWEAEMPHALKFLAK